MIEPGPLHVNFTNATIRFSENVVTIENTFEPARTPEQVKNWAIMATTQFAGLLSYWTGVRFDVDSITWTINAEDSGITVEYGIEPQVRAERRASTAEGLGAMAPYLSWLGVSYNTSFALEAYRSALGSMEVVDQLSHLYRVLEILEEGFGGEGEFITFLKGYGITKVRYKRVKRTINKGTYFIRHSPKRGKRIRPVPKADVSRCWETTREVLQFCIEHEHQKRLVENAPGRSDSIKGRGIGDSIKD